MDELIWWVRGLELGLRRLISRYFVTPSFRRYCVAPHKKYLYMGLGIGTRALDLGLVFTYPYTELRFSEVGFS